MKVYKFGALPPTENRELVIEQMRLANAYYNDLVETRNRLVSEARGTEEPPVDPDEAKAFWRQIRKRIRENTGFIDLKPFRAKWVSKGLYWGTYLLIEESFSRAQTRVSEPGAKHVNTAPIRFRSWQRSKHRIGVQIQKPERAETNFRIEDTLDTRRRRGGQRKVLWVRVGSNGRNPVWAKFPFTMHRAVLGRVRAVQVSREVVCGREKWFALFTCSDTPVREDGGRSGAVAVDVGWRLIDGEIRVAYAQGADGRLFELRLNERWVERTKRMERIASVRGKLLDRVLKEHSLHPVRSAAGVERRYREGNAELEEFVHRDRHLWQYEMGNRRRAVQHRKEMMRRFARDLRRKYACLILKNDCIKEMKEKKDLPQGARRNGQHGAPGEMLEILREVFADGIVIEVKGTDTSRTCAFCGYVNEIFADRILLCESCNDEQDRDNVSTRNMLKEVEQGNLSWKAPRKRAPRFAKRHTNREKGGNASSTA